MSKKLIIMRHASWVKAGELHPLSEQGKLEAIAAANETRKLLGSNALDAAYYSPFCRTEQTAKIIAAVSQGIVKPFNQFAKPPGFFKRAAIKVFGENSKPPSDAANHEISKKDISIHKTNWLGMMTEEYIAKIRKLPDDQGVVLLVTHDQTMNTVALEIERALGTKNGSKIRKQIESVAPLKASGVVLDSGKDSWQNFATTNIDIVGDFVCGGMSQHLDMDQELEHQIEEALAL